MSDIFNTYYENAINKLDPLNTYPPTVDIEEAMPIIPPPEFENITSVRDLYLASQQYEYLVEQIKDFESRLDNEHETAIQLASFGQSILMSVTEIGYQNPSLIFYYGFVDGKECQLIQNINQMNFLLMAVTKSDPQKPPRRIGFLSEE